MKNLQIKYKKKLLQNSKIEFNLYKNKIEFYVSRNSIGFNNEYFRPDEKMCVDNICNYNHVVSSANRKLWLKYPMGILKKDYKRWLEDNK